MNKVKLNYWVDLIIGISFVFSAISGLVFLLPVNPDGVTIFNKWQKLIARFWFL